MKNVKIVTHYDKEDTEFMGDYASMELYIDDELVQSLGDWYHDKSSSQVQGWIDCLKYLYGKTQVVVTREDIADY